MSCCCRRRRLCSHRKHCEPPVALNREGGRQGRATPFCPPTLSSALVMHPAITTWEKASLTVGSGCHTPKRGGPTYLQPPLPQARSSEDAVKTGDLA
ncbi:hypothetical protein CDL15_Pgr022124 [Punica granatum]|uniref:Uncharacterized protein n=1 Tax=Punica granatum TaxID=22663 RepID=A0A218VSW2_PUNGR|nr:hypothetical protein CDL15_Pgr022124 [Punica granatum]PKI70647.1 hypothetical protein CRG98_008880 [Punica granatum]